MKPSCEAATTSASRKRSADRGGIVDAPSVINSTIQSMNTRYLKEMVTSGRVGHEHRHYLQLRVVEQPCRAVAQTMGGLLRDTASEYSLLVEHFRISSVRFWPVVASREGFYWQCFIRYKWTAMAGFSVDKLPVVDLRLNHFIGCEIEPLHVQFLLDGSEKSYSMLKGSVVDSLIGVTPSEALSYPHRIVVFRCTSGATHNRTKRNGRVLISGLRKGIFRCTLSGQLKVIRVNKFRAGKHLVIAIRGVRLV